MSKLSLARSPKRPCVAAVLPECRRLPATPEAVGRARSLVHQLLAAAGCLDAELADTAVLLTSELATNAITHGPSGNDHRIEVTVWLADGHLWVAVADAGDLRPAPYRPTHDDDHGRGMQLVDSLSAVWGIAARPVVGKAVYFALPWAQT
jgi:anti-sigma regulatory factor (Ser/Thr protein kinase)